MWGTKKCSPNRFQITRAYKRRPTGVSDKDTSFERFVSDAIRRCRNFRKKDDVEARPLRDVSDIIYPYPKLSAFMFSRWSNSSGKRTKRDRNALLNDVLFHKNFQLGDIDGLNFDALDKKAVEYYNSTVEDECRRKGWKKSTVYVKVPTGVKETKATRKKAAADRRRAKLDAQDRVDPQDEDEDCSQPPNNRARFHRFPIPNFYHRSLVSVVQEACSSTDSKEFHWHPYEECWSPPWDPATTERIHGELYSLSAFLEADSQLHASPPEPNCDLPCCVAAIMVYSDGTQVAQFGQASLWPVYVYLGNQSKYERGQASSQTAYNVAFLPSLPDEIVDFIYQTTGNHPSAALLTHCKRELYHACFGVLYDDDFLAAYEHGIVVDCCDGIRRRMYPRIFIHSADYKEKVLVVTIKDFGSCACPRCKIRTEEFWKAAMPCDMKARAELARIDDDERRKKVQSALELIYEKGYVVDSDRVDDFLKSESLLPTKNVYSNPVFLERGLNIFDLAVVDLMHEVELGVWKSLLQHLLRVLYCQGAGVVQIFNARFRKICPFGVDTIRTFGMNVSDLKQLAARDYEDILQCIIPCIEGLLPGAFNETVLDLLYTFTLFTPRLEAGNNQPQDALCYFASETCKHFKTVETDKEYQSRQRRTASYNLKNGKSVSVNGRKPKKFSLITIKFHVLPDYPEHIMRFGTTDCYTTRRGETRHRLVKGFYRRTNQNNPIPQIIKLDNLSAIHSHMQKELDSQNRQLTKGKRRDLSIDDSDGSSDTEGQQGLTNFSQLKQHYAIAASVKNSVILPLWLQPLQHDSATKDFILRLKAYFLMWHMKENGQPTGTAVAFDEVKLASVRIKDHTIYPHATAAFHYTTYDLRRERDGVHNKNTAGGEPIRSDVMLFNTTPSSNARPYTYARVLGVYHANVYFQDSQKPERIEFLWREDDNVFGFLHPSMIIRACHLIPAFELGRTTKLLGPSIARHPEGDWVNYYVNRFVDRDMTMRYLGIGVGHCLPADFPREDGQLLMLPTSGPNYAITPEVGEEHLAEETTDEVDQWFAEQAEGIDNDADSNVDADSNNGLVNENMSENGFEY